MRVRCLLLCTAILAFIPYLAGHRLSFRDDYRGMRAIRVMSYNAENLFHPSVDSLNPDHEFTPEGGRHWGWSKYHGKIGRIARVILACGGWEAPALVGLCEVESREVLFDLCRRSPLARYGYRFVHQESQDPRGIESAMLYRPDKIRLLDQSFIPVRIPSLGGAYSSRDILYAKVLVLGRDTMHVLVNHWPSRRSGEEASRYKRRIAADVVTRFLEGRVRNDGAVLMMGDFNDEPGDSSIRALLRCPGRSLGIPPHLPSHVEVGGSLVFDPGTGPHWYSFDHILVSAALRDPDSGLQADSCQHILSMPWLLEAVEGHAISRPYRTYHGYVHREGYSDHLPVFIDLFRKGALE